jgi:ubiquinone/menaquinone biosynthesis C-methylase UbiE
MYKQCINFGRRLKKLAALTKAKKPELSHMALYRDRIYPHFSQWVATQIYKNPELQDVVQKFVAQAKGEVLEVGVGGGGNLKLYDPSKVSLVYALDPQPRNLSMARIQAKEVDFEVRFIERGAEDIPLPEDNVDTILSTFSFCTISDLPAALTEIKRVLRPQGRLLFMEHGLAPDKWVRRWQYVEEPLHKWLFQGCSLTRVIPRYLEDAGFQIQEVFERYLPGGPKPWMYCWFGTGVTST